MQRQTLAASILLAAVACSSGPGSTSGDEAPGVTDPSGRGGDAGTAEASDAGAGAGPGGDAGTSCAVSHFGAAQSFVFPAELDARYAADALPLVAGDRACSSTGTYRFLTMDLSGDRKPDLVMQRDDCTSGGNVGRTRWTLFSNQTTGFAAPLPFTFAPGLDGRFVERTGLSGASCGGSGTFDYVTMDLTGDGKPDLVVTSDGCTPDAQVGTSKWTVYPNTGTGFGPAQAFGLPSAIDARYGTKPLSKTTDTRRSCGANGSEFSFVTTDLTGDGKPDLVLTYDDCTSDLASGQSRWTVFPNTGAGFGPGQAFTLPTLDPKYGGRVLLSTTGADVRCQNQNNRFDFTTLDMTGDGKPDLLFTRDACGGDAQVGTSKWTLFPNTGTGCGPAQSCAFPAEIDARYGAQPLSGMAANDRTCQDGNSSFSFAVMDLTGDRKPDLVLTDDGCRYDLELGASKWNLFPNTGSGFGPAQAFRLPAPASAGRGSRPFTKISQIDAACTNNSAKYGYTTMDLTGDGKPDLVLTRDACTDPAVGKTKWTVFPGACGP